MTLLTTDTDPIRRPALGLRPLLTRVVARALRLARPEIDADALRSARARQAAARAATDALLRR